MKKLLIVLFALGLTFGASAQRSHGSVGGGHYVRPHVTIVAPIRPYYGFGYAYSPFYNPYYDPFFIAPMYHSTPSKLDLQVEDINNDYQYQISTVRHDKSLSGQARRQKIRDLKHERDEAIIDAKKNYYKADDRA